MEQQTDKNQSDDFMFYKDRTKKIDRHGVIGMQRMKPDAAPSWSENRVGQEMICVH